MFLLHFYGVLQASGLCLRLKAYGREAEPITGGGGHQPMTAVVDEVFVIQDNDQEFMEVNLHDSDNNDNSRRRSGGRVGQEDGDDEEDEMGV